MEDLSSDSYKLIKKILSDSYEDLILLHIAQTELPTFSFPAAPEIPTCYGYVIDSTPSFLQQEGIISILSSYITLHDFKSLRVTGAGKRGTDKIRELLQMRFKKFTGKDCNALGYSFYTPARKNITLLRGLYYVVVDRKKAGEFITQHSAKQSSMIDAAKRFMENKEDEEKEKRLQKLEETVNVLAQSQKRTTSSQAVKELLDQYRFPKKQKKLLLKLSKKERDTKTLTKELETNDLPSLKRDTSITIAKHGLNDVIKVTTRREGKNSGRYLYGLQINMDFFRKLPVRGAK